MKRTTLVLTAFAATMALSCQKEIQKSQEQTTTTSLSTADYVGDVYSQSNTDTNKVSVPVLSEKAGRISTRTSQYRRYA